MKEILAEKELQKLLGVSRTTTRKLRKEGLPFIKVGREYRYIWGDVLEWFKKQYYGPKPIDKIPNNGL